MVSALEIKVQELIQSLKDSKVELTMAQESSQKLQAGLEVSNGLLEHTRQDNQQLELRLDTSLTQMATTQAELHRISAEAEAAYRDQKESENLKNNRRDVKSSDGSITISGDVLENLVLQNQAQGLNLSIGIPIAIMTWASFQVAAPDGNSRMNYTVANRFRECAEKVRKYASTLPQYRGQFRDEDAWNDYLDSIQSHVIKLTMPRNDSGKITNPGATFRNQYPSVIRENR